jgi:hypothetical protein
MAAKKRRSRSNRRTCIWRSLASRMAKSIFQSNTIQEMQCQGNVRQRNGKKRKKCLSSVLRPFGQMRCCYGSTLGKDLSLGASLDADRDSWDNVDVRLIGMAIWRDTVVGTPCCQSAMDEFGDFAGLDVKLAEGRKDEYGRCVQRGRIKPDQAESRQIRPNPTKSDQIRPAEGKKCPKIGQSDDIKKN